MKCVHVDAMGLVGPGLASWQDSLEVLADESAYRAGESPRCTSKLLPANERRRVSLTARLALQVAEEAMAQSSLDIASVCSVFATCHGDTEVIDKICVALTEPERPLPLPATLPQNMQLLRIRSLLEPTIPPPPNTVLLLTTVVLVMVVVPNVLCIPPPLLALLLQIRVFRIDTALFPPPTYIPPPRFPERLL